MGTDGPKPRFVIAVSLKMYFGHQQTMQWCDAIARLADTHPAVTSGDVELVALPSFPALVQARALLGPQVRLGAQDLAMDDSGAFTGEVSGAELAEIGCTVAEVGHAERRRLCGETESVVGQKVVAALRNGLVPLICVGEGKQGAAGTAAETVACELRRLLEPARSAGYSGPVLVAYEPHWAIGAPEPAPTDHIAGVCSRLQNDLDTDPDFSGQVVYGGSAGPGLLTALGGTPRGLFLGRFAHEPAALAQILDETTNLRGVTA